MTTKLNKKTRLMLKLTKILSDLVDNGVEVIAEGKKSRVVITIPNASICLSGLFSHSDNPWKDYTYFLTLEPNSIELFEFIRAHILNNL